MRVTSFTIFNQVTRSLQERMRDMALYSDRLTTGKKINKPSDDVSGMMSAMDYKVSLNEVELYKKNIDNAESHLGMIDTVMDSAASLLTRARELAVQASSGTQTPEDRASVAKEVSNLRDEMFRLAQTQFRDRYIFSGYKTDTGPFDASFNYQGDSGEIGVLIGKDSTLSVNIPGDEAFSYGGITFMETLDDLNTALENNDLTAIQGSLTSFDNDLAQVANVRAEVGAKMSRIEDLKSDLDNRSFTLTTLLSNTQDADLAETVSELAKIQVALESLRASGSQVISQSLLDFIQ